MGNWRFRSRRRQPVRPAALQALSHAAASGEVLRRDLRTSRAKTWLASVPRANASGVVGKYRMLNSGGVTTAVFEHPLNDYKGFAVSRILHDFYELDPQKVGFCGGGGLDARFDLTPISFALGSLPPDTARWG